MKSFSPRASSSALGALNATLSLNMSGSAAGLMTSDEVWVHVTGTFVGTITFQGSLDNVNWFTLGVIDAATGSVVSTTTAVGAFIVGNNPPFLRMNMTAYTSGTAVVASADGQLKD